MDIKNGWVARAGALFNEGGPWGGGKGSGDSGGGGGGNGGGPRNPWSLPPGGKPRGPRGNSAVDELSRKLREQFGGGNFSGGNNSKYIRFGILAFVLLWIVLTSFHRIEAQQEGVVTRFGKYNGRLQPGIGFTLPAPIDRVEKVDVRAINTTNIPEGDGANFILTRDQNIIDLAYSVRWDKSNPENYLFELANPDETIKEVAESAMREVISQVTLTDAFGPGRGAIESRVGTRMQQLLNSYSSGVTIRGVAIKHALPPAEVVEAFNLVTVKQQEKQGNINNANLYAQQVIARAQGEATSFDKVYAQYKLSPDVFRKRMYYDTMEAVLSNTNKTIVEPSSIAPFLPLAPGGPRVTVEPSK